LPRGHTRTGKVGRASSDNSFAARRPAGEASRIGSQPSPAARFPNHPPAGPVTLQRGTCSMPDPYRVGVAGLIHDHIWGMLRWWKELQGTELVAAADVNPPLLDRIRSEFGVQKTYGSYAEMLEQERLDIVTVAMDNASTADVVEAAAAKGVHVISEK